MINMKTMFLKIFILTIVISFAAGCGTIENFQSSNANVEDKTRETLGLKKTGIAECDEVIDILDRKRRGNSNVEEQSWADKAMTELVKQQIYNYVNEGNANRPPKEREDLRQKCKTVLGYLKDEPKK
jgi:hypothetical protein